jgi:hypothetical protein
MYESAKGLQAEKLRANLRAAQPIDKFSESQRV